VFKVGPEKSYLKTVVLYEMGHECLHCYESFTCYRDELIRSVTMINITGMNRMFRKALSGGQIQNTSGVTQKEHGEPSVA